MLQKIKYLILIGFLAPLLFATDTNIDSYVRANSAVDLTQGTKVTKMPYGYFVGQFGKSSMKLLDKKDLSNYTNKKLLVGYGVYDIKDENCRYLDVPSNKDFNIAFESIYVVGNETFAISRDKVTYAGCLAKAAKYSAFVFTPSSLTEMSMSENKFGKEKDMWLGYTREDCNKGYKLDENFAQSYENFETPVETCLESKRFTFSPANTKKWERVNQSELHYCPVKIASPDYKRPIKFCLPWWRVERKIQLNKDDEILEYNGREHDYRYLRYMADYTEEHIICTEIGASAVVDQGVRFKQTCRSYDSIYASPVCVESITQPVCHVNECAGYIQNTCVKKSSFEPFKNYDIGVILIDGIETRVKSKDNKIIHEYSCPPPPKSIDDCLKKEKVRVFGIECPYTKCTEYGSCISSGVSQEDCLKKYPCSKCDEFATCLIGDAFTFEECKQKFPCEKNFGTSDNIIRDLNGTAVALGGVCSDGVTTIEAPIELMARIKKTCLEFFQIEQTSESFKTCISEATKEDKVVTAPITANDLYINDDRCIRINNIEESRPSVQTVFEYETNGFFKTSIKKAYIDGTVNIEEADSDIEYMLTASALKLEAVNLNREVNIKNDTAGNNFCKTNFSNKWYENRLQELNSIAGKLSKIEGYLGRKNDAKAVEFNVPYIEYRSKVNEMALKSGITKAGNGIYYTTIKGKSTPSGAKSDCSKLGSQWRLPKGVETVGSGKVPSGGYEFVYTDSSVCGHGYVLATASDCKGYKFGWGDVRSYRCVTADANSARTTVKKCPIGFTETIGAERAKGECRKASYQRYYNYPIIAISKDKSQCSSLKTLLNFSLDTKNKVLYEDYDFQFLNITKKMVKNNELCILGGNRIVGDEVFGRIKNLGTEVKLSSRDNISFTQCTNYAKCLSADIETIYSGNEDKKCNVKVNDTSGRSTINSTSPISEYSLPAKKEIKKSSGTFASTLNGYSDIFSIEEYTEGNFGYISNYLFSLPKNNIVKLEGREISPIVGHTPIVYKTFLDHSTGQNNQITKNRTPDNHKGKAKGFNVVSTYLGDKRLFGSTLISTIFATTFGPIAIFGSKQYWGWYNSKYKIFQTINAQNRYVPNYYGYDPRIVKDNNLLWIEEDIESGTMSESSYVNFRNNLIGEKTERFEEMGFQNSTIARILTNHDEKNAIGWPGIKWYKPSDKKTNTSSDIRNDVHVPKLVNTVFMGAVNSLAIVVPYAGDYEMKAYDKNNNVLATKIITKENYIKNSSATSGNVAQVYAKVQFTTADDFNIVAGQNRLETTGSCLGSNFVEWGGGVSGAYYEQGVPDISMNSNCTKSNDEYVLKHSATKITLRAINATDVFVVKLKKPMPYPNRVVLVNLLRQENRKYECWSNIGTCNIDNNTTK